MTQKQIHRDITRKQYIIAGIIILVLIIDLSFTGFLKFGYNVARCGKLPVKITHTHFLGDDEWYDLPNNYFPGGADNEYVCTEQDAINQGVRKGV